MENNTCNICGDKINEEENVVNDWKQRVDKPLADLRAKTIIEIKKLKQSIDTDGVCIGISPNDGILNKHTRGELTEFIQKLFERMRIKGVDGHLNPIKPLVLVLVGEYSPKHRWHYHGIIKVNNIVTLDKIKKKINQIIGRCITEQIRNDESYIDYMFKQYIGDDSNYYVWNKDECYIEVKH